MSGWNTSFIWIETGSAGGTAELVEVLRGADPGQDYENGPWAMSVGALGPRLVLVEAVQKRGFSSWLVNRVKAAAPTRRVFWTVEESTGQTDPAEDFRLAWDFAVSLDGDIVDFDDTMGAVGGAIEKIDDKCVALLPAPLEFSRASISYDAGGPNLGVSDPNVPIIERLLVENDGRLSRRPLRLALGLRCRHGWIGTAVLDLLPMTPNFDGGGAILDVTGECNVPQPIFSIGMGPSRRRKKKRSPPPWACFER